MRRAARARLSRRDHHPRARRAWRVKAARTCAKRRRRSRRRRIDGARARERIHARRPCLRDRAQRTCANRHPVEVSRVRSPRTRVGVCAPLTRARRRRWFLEESTAGAGFQSPKKSSARRKSPSLRPSPSVAPRSKSILFATIKHGTGKPPKPCITHGCSPLAKLSAVGAVGAENVPLAATSRAHASPPRPARARRRIVHDDHPVYLIVEYPSLSFILSMSAHVPQFDKVRRRVARPRRRPPLAPLARVHHLRVAPARPRALPPRARARVRPARASASSSPPPSRRSRARAPCDASSSSSRSTPTRSAVATARARASRRRRAIARSPAARRRAVATVAPAVGRRGSGDAARARPLNPRGRS